MERTVVCVCVFGVAYLTKETKKLNVDFISWRGRETYQRVEEKNIIEREKRGNGRNNNNKSKGGAKFKARVEMGVKGGGGDK